jgi:hypothetical protein
MPKVTLLGNPGKTYTYYFGKKEFVFLSGVPQEVPVAVALSLQGKTNRKGKPIFKVVDLPEIITSAPVPHPNMAKEQNGSRQMRFGPWQ